jgi:KDO2-lipid IV(A) lauroyltransferase
MAYICQKKELGQLLFIFLKTVSYLPFWFWHGFADILWVLNYHIIGYRKNVVLENLRIAFPEKTENERKRIAKKFFRNFSDFIIESIKAFSMSEKQFKKRYQITNVDELNRVLLNSKKGAIITAGHIFSWEWMISVGASLSREIVGRVAYTPLSNKALNKLIKENRERFGLKMTPSNKFTKTLEQNYKSEISLTGLISDQSPRENYKFWTDFFGVKVPVYTGPETMAKRFDQSYWFLKTTKIGRSKYSLEFELLSENPSEVGDNELTELFIKKLEDQIRAFPDNYLWTHRRWKHANKKAEI